MYSQCVQIGLFLLANFLAKVAQLFSLKSLSSKKAHSLGGSPGLVVMGGDSCSEGRGFESQRRKLDGDLEIFLH